MNEVIRMNDDLPVFESRGPALKNAIMVSMDALSPFIFQLPPTKNLRPILIEARLTLLMA